jgi:hypothetical protein
MLVLQMVAKGIGADPRGIGKNRVTKFAERLSIEYVEVVVVFASASRLHREHGGF